MDVIEKFQGEFEAIEADVKRKIDESVAVAIADKAAEIETLKAQVEQAKEEAGRSVIDEIKRRLQIF